PCGDHYCQPCLRRMFLNATKEESLYPPRCCKVAIPAEEVLKLGVLDGDEVREYRERAEEYATAKRVYCHNTKCGKFIPSSRILREKDTGSCLYCATLTCIHCGKKNHPGECPEDEDLTKTLELGKLQKWKRCEKCKRMVDRKAGCEHMT
ncbi:hypothetical protein BJ508DRAFT_201867, partial [Ascobolus immersus RN42]